MKDQKVNIALIGMGVSGILSFLRLVKSFKNESHRITISIFDKQNIWDNKAFNVCSNELLMNTSLSMNSLMPDDEDHFSRWYLRKLSATELEHELAVPRNIFAQYMKECYFDGLTQAESFALSVKVINEYITSIEFYSQEINIIQDSRGEIYYFNYIIIGTGALNSSQQCIYDDISNTPYFFDTPYRCNILEYEKILNTRSALILGSGLSAIDAVVLLQELSYQGLITLASRKGGFPAIRKYYAYRSFYEGTGQYAFIHSISEAVEFFNHLIISTKSIEKDSFQHNRHNSWESQVIPFINRINELWFVSSDREKQYFKDCKNQYLFRYMATYYDALNKKMSTLFEKNQLRIVHTITSIHYQNKRYVAVVNGCTETYDSVIKAFNIVPNTVCCIKNLQSIIAEYPITSENFRLKNKNIFLSGAMTNEMAGVNNAVYLIKRQSKKIVQSIYNEVTHKDAVLQFDQAHY